MALLLAAAPPEDHLKAFRSTLGAVEAREAAWWKDLPDAEEKAYRDFFRPLREQYLRKVTEPRADFAPIRALYGEALAFEGQRAEAYRLLAASGHGKTLATLWREALAAADLEAEAERANLPGELKQAAFLLRQGPSIRLHALARRREALRKAFSAAGGAAAFLGDPSTWKEARAADLGGRSPSRRAFLVDALAALPGEAGHARLRELLGDEAFEVRIAAAEGLAAAREGLPVEAAPLLLDPAPAARFAVLDLLLARTPADPRWIEPVAGAYLASKGRLRADALRGIEALSGRVAGDDAGGWKAWLAETRAARADGTFRRPEVPAAAPSAPAPGPVARFFGIPVESDRVLLAADGWSTLAVPADHSLQATRHVHDWVTGAREWKKERESLQDVLARQIPPLVEGLPPGATFNVLLNGSPGNRPGEVTWFEERGFLPATRANGARARDFAAGFHIGTTEFTQQGIQGLFATKEPDTAVLVASGMLRTDRFLLPEALVEDAGRRNRFRRLRLHVVHVMDHGPEVGAMLAALAKATGGTLVRALVPPPR